jgi:hypothetical protein
MWAALVLAVPLVPSAVAANTTVGAVLTAAKDAIAKQTGVHLQVVSKSASSASTQRIVGDLGLKAGTETVSEGAGKVTIRVTPTYGYLSGNASGLKDIAGMTAAQVKKVGKFWVSVKAGTTPYASIATDMTAPSIVAVLPRAKGTQLSWGTAAGANLYVLKWKTPATSSTLALSITLTLAATGAPLPVQQTTVASNGSKETVRFSKWGERVSVSAPPASSVIPYSKVAG